MSSTATATGPAHPSQAAARLETVVLLALAIVLAVVVKTFFVQAFYIPSGSMKPGLVINDRIMVQKVSYWGDDPPDRRRDRGVRGPGGWLDGEPPGPDQQPHQAAREGRACSRPAATW